MANPPTWNAWKPARSISLAVSASCAAGSKSGPFRESTFFQAGLAFERLAIDRSSPPDPWSDRPEQTSGQSDRFGTPQGKGGRGRAGEVPPARRGGQGSG